MQLINFFNFSASSILMILTLGLCFWDENQEIKVTFSDIQSEDLFLIFLVIPICYWDENREITVIFKVKAFSERLHFRSGRSKVLYEFTVNSIKQPEKLACSSKRYVTIKSLFKMRGKTMQLSIPTS